MGMFRRALGIAGIVLSSFGCSVDEGEKFKEETLTGKPISVSSKMDNGYGSFAIVLYVKDRPKPVLCVGNYGQKMDIKLTREKIAEIEALVESEIQNLDDEEIEVMGYYKTDRFMVKKVKVNGYEVDFTD